MLKKVEISTLVILIIFAFYCALIVGLSWDNFFHLDLGNRRLKYLLSFGSNDYFSYTDQKFYPGFHSIFTQFIRCIEYS